MTIEKHVFAVTITVKTVSGSALAASIHQGAGEQHIKAYLAAKMPAGSPLTIEHVTQVTR